MNTTPSTIFETAATALESAAERWHIRSEHQRSLSRSKLRKSTSMDTRLSTAAHDDTTSATLPRSSTSSRLSAFADARSDPFDSSHSSLRCLHHALAGAAADVAYSRTVSIRCMHPVTHAIVRCRDPLWEKTKEFAMALEAIEALPWGSCSAFTKAAIMAELEETLKYMEYQIQLLRKQGRSSTHPLLVPLQKIHSAISTNGVIDFDLILVISIKAAAIAHAQNVLEVASTQPAASSGPFGGLEGFESAFQFQDEEAIFAVWGLDGVVAGIEAGAWEALQVGLSNMAAWSVSFLCSTEQENNILFRFDKILDGKPAAPQSPNAGANPDLSRLSPLRAVSIYTSQQQQSKNTRVANAPIASSTRTYAVVSKITARDTHSQMPRSDSAIHVLQAETATLSTSGSSQTPIMKPPKLRVTHHHKKSKRSVVKIETSDERRVEVEREGPSGSAVQEQTFSTPANSDRPAQPDNPGREDPERLTANRFGIKKLLTTWSSETFKLILG
ncbi:hypothetical protein BJ741DRAFT_594111 [Chytriomyces cf. hyalinus JEL632]|nr:hypothetical protein BJ741DRAFT_594111 [Chytriomyces cf. hyalinus JEL632]